MFKNTSIKLKATLAFSLICLTVIVTGIITYSSLRQLDEASKADLHSAEVQQTILAVRVNMLNRETAIRG